MKRIAKISYGLLFISCVLLPFSYQLSTIGCIAFSVLATIHGILNNKHKKRLLNKADLALPWLLFLIPVIGLAYTSYIQEAIDRIVKYLPYLIFSLGYFFSDKSIKEEAQKHIRLGLIVGVSGTFIFLFWSLFFGQLTEAPSTLKELFSYKHTYRNFIKPLDTHTTYLGLLALMANMFIYNSNFKWYGKFALLALNFFGLLFMASKAIMGLYVIQFISLFFFLKSKKLKWAMLLIGVAVIGIIAYLYKYKLRDVYFLQRISKEIVWDFDSSNVGTSVNGKTNDDSRFARWSAILEETKEKPLFGYGAGSEEATLRKIHNEYGMLESLKRNYNTHNQYLYFILEMGLWGFLIFVYFFASNIFLAIKTKNYEITFLIVSLLLISFVENYFNRTMGVLAVALFFTFLKKNEENSLNI